MRRSTQRGDHCSLTGQVFTPKDKLAEWFEIYAKALELNVWTKTNLTDSNWDASKRQWTLTLEREIGEKKETRTACKSVD